MMAILTANHTTNTFHVICRECLWAAPTPLREDDAFDTANAHKDQCPGHIPTTRTPAQQRRARKILSGNY